MDHIQKEQLDLQKAFKQKKADDSDTMLNIKCSQNNDIEIHCEDSAEECFPASCCLQHYANTDTSKMQLNSEEAQEAQS